MDKKKKKKKVNKLKKDELKAYRKFLFENNQQNSKHFNHVNARLKAAGFPYLLQVAG